MMTSNYKHFESGMIYRLGRLLDSDVKIIIPDLQRDYCWGTSQSDNGVSLAEQFTRDLLEQFELNSRDLSLGLLYGYEVPVGHLQLCDGQQRITTLYLMLGLLNRKTKTLEDRLLSQREMDEFQEPYLQYAIRETTLYFMSDLVSEFFCDDDESIKNVDEIRNQSWYFKEYDQDPSIISMMKAMKDIESIIDEKITNESIIPYRFAYFLCHEVRFIYYDMLSRREGEKTFVIINTKGEPLSPTENLKPIFLDAYKDNDKVCETWEEWETYFWQHRNETIGNDTADAGMREFFRWIMLIHYVVNDLEDTEDYKKLRESGIYKFDTENIKYEDIKDYFRIIKTLFDTNGFFSEEQALLSPREYDSNGTPTTNQNAWYRLLPVMLFMHKYKKATHREIQRIYQFFAHTSRLQNVQKDIRTLLPGAIKSVNEMTSADILTIGQTNSTIFTKEEKHKLDLIGAFPNQRQDLEDALWNAENYHIWQSTIMPLIQWATDSNGSFILNELMTYQNIVQMIFDLDKDSELDLFRRLLRKQVLCSNASNYPCLIEKFEPKSLTYKSFGYHDNQWREIIEKNSDSVRVLLDALKTCTSSMQVVTQMRTMLGIITSFDPMVCNPELLANCKYKLVQDGDNFNYKLVQQKRAKVAFRKSFLWYLYVKSLNKSLPHNWRLVDYYWSVDGGCTYFESDEKTNGQRLAINVAWKQQAVVIYLFSRDDNQTKLLCQDKANKKRMLWDEDLKKYSLLFNKYSTKQFIYNIVLSIMS